MLERLLSTGGAALYRRLLDSGTLWLGGDSEGDVAFDDERVQELLRLGFAVDVADQGWLVPQAPMMVFQHLLAERQQRIDTELNDLAEAYRQLEVAQRAFTRSKMPTGGQSEGDLARVVTGWEETSAWADHLRFSAEWECLELSPVPKTNVPHGFRFMDAPAEQLQRGVRYRCVYAREWLEIGGSESHVFPPSSSTWWEEARFLAGLDFRMRITDDHTAMIALLPRALDASLLVQTRHTVAALRQLFEHFWSQAEPLTGASSQQQDLTQTQREVLRLLAAGLKDDAIARALGVSVKTVQRHVANLLHRTGADTRFAAGVEAACRGWLD